MGCVRLAAHVKGVYAYEECEVSVVLENSLSVWRINNGNKILGVSS